MVNKVGFEKEDFELLLSLKNKTENFELFRMGAEVRIKELENEVSRQREIIAKMIWAGTKATLIASGAFGGLIAIGYWLTSSANYRAVEAFFKTLRGEQ